MAALVVAGAALAYVIPLLFSRYFPGLDLPWHAATVEAVHRHDAADVSRDFLGFIAVDHRVTTYLVMYQTVDLLAFVTGDVVIAMQTLIVLYVLAFVWSVRRLLIAFGGDGVVAVLAAPAAFSLTMQYGFLAYAICYPMTFWLWAFARELFAHPRTTTYGPKQRRALAWRLGVIAVLGVLISIGHPYAAAIAMGGGALIILSHAERGQVGRAALGLVVLAIGAVPTLLALLTMGGDDPTSPWHRLEGATLWDKLRAQRFVEPGEALSAAPARLFGFVSDGWRFALTAAGLIAAVLSRHFGERPDPESGLRGRSVAWLFLLMCAVYLATPYTFEWPIIWYGAQPRVLPVIWVLALLLLRARGTVQQPAGALLPPVAVAGAALVLFSVTVFLPFTREASDFRDVIEEGAPRVRTLGLIEQPRTVDRTPASPWRNSTAYVLVEHGGLVSGLPMLRRKSGKAGLFSPVHLAEDAPPMPPAVQPGFPRRFDFAVHGEGWDQFLIRDSDPAHPFDYFRQHHDRVRLVARAGRWRLYAKKP